MAELREIIRLVEQSVDEPGLDAAELASRACLSRFHFDRLASRGAGSALVVDHENTASVAVLLATIEREHGRLDVLVNDIFGGDRYAEWDKPLWEHDWVGGLRMLQMGVHTHLTTCQAAIPLMMRTAAAKGTRSLVIEMTDGTSAGELRRH
jgi:NAD(P)-dependent dehydrogenase (short-subunit alcohol dehydrogenase family)